MEISKVWNDSSRTSHSRLLLLPDAADMELHYLEKKYGIRINLIGWS
jgi:hypothetical protein